MSVPDDLSSEVAAWINRLSAAHDQLSGLPACPFARSAWRRGVVAVNDRRSSPDVAAACGETIAAWDGCLEVAIDVLGAIDYQSLIAIVDDLNRTSSRRGLVHLADHPAMPCVVPGLETTFGLHPLVLTQPIVALEAARQGLRALGYYAAWPPYALDLVGIDRVD